MQLHLITTKFQYQLLTISHLIILLIRILPGIFQKTADLDCIFCTHLREAEFSIVITQVK